MKSKILWFFTLLPTIVTAFIVPHLKDKVPMHYDALGNIDRLGSKYESFTFPIIITVMTLFWTLLLHYFKKKQRTSTNEKAIAEAKLNEKVIYYTALGMAIMFTVIHFAMMLSNFIEVEKQMTTMAIDINVVTNIAVSLLLIVVGNLLPKSKPNGIVGLRTPWSLKNDVTWSKSNRFAGILLVICGVLIILESIFIGGLLSTLIMVILLIGFTIIASIYSYKIANEDDKMPMS